MVRNLNTANTYVYCVVLPSN